MITPGEFGSSDVYPSKAAGYGTEGLMAMAGTLAEQAEQWVKDASSQYTSLATVQDVAAIAQVYATLALAQAVRDQNDILTAAGREAEDGGQ